MTDEGRAVLDAFAAPAGAAPPPGPGPSSGANGAGPYPRSRLHPLTLRIQIDAETLARIEKVAARKRENRSVVVRQLLDEALYEWEKD